MKIISPLLCLAIVAGLATFARLHPPQGALVPSSDWAYDLATQAGNPQPTQAVLDYLEAWHRAEGGTAAFNPLNTTMPAEGDSLYNSVGVRNYPSYEAGIEATVETLRGYPRTLAGIQTNQPVIDDAEMRTWGTGAAAIRAQMEETQVGTHARVSSNKSVVTPTMAVGAHFGTRDCAAWGFQVACQHWGTDLLGDEGTPVYAPFDMQVIALGDYPPGPTWGQYVQGVFSDGYVFYAGHLQNRAAMRIGDVLAAGSLLGFTNAYNHTHIQMSGPGNTGPCAQDGSCIDFEIYWSTH